MRKPELSFGRPNYSQAEISAVAEVIHSGWLGMGTQTLAFEQELADYLQVPYVVTVNSCTSALFLALLLEHVQPGDEVICPSLTWSSTANIILHHGATPVFCDVDPETFCLSIDTVLEKLSSQTKAVIPVHYGGLAVDVQELRAVLPEHVTIIEDAAHAFGGRYPDGTPVGSSGNCVCFSFYANKNLSTADGGAIALFDDVQAERLRSLRQNGLKTTAWSRHHVSHKKTIFREINEIGYKMNYTDLQAAIGRSQLRRFDHLQALRHENVCTYADWAKQSTFNLQVQSGITSRHHAKHLFVIKMPTDVCGQARDNLIRALNHANIGATVHYKPLHHYPLYAEYATSPLPITDTMARHLVSLPLSSCMNSEDVHQVTTAVNQFLATV